MPLGKIILSVLLPPLAVADKGCGTIAIVAILTLLLWVPGVLAALFINLRDARRIPNTTANRSASILSAASDAKSSPIFTGSQSSHPSRSSSAPPWIDSQTATPADTANETGAPDEPVQPPSRPKPPWEP